MYRPAMNCATSKQQTLLLEIKGSGVFFKEKTPDPFLGDPFLMATPF